MNIVHSVNNVPIRFPRERWFHIVENHNDLAGYYDDVLRTVEEPDLVLQGYMPPLSLFADMGNEDTCRSSIGNFQRNDGPSEASPRIDTA